jgi:hypothetical protein
VTPRHLYDFISVVLDTRKTLPPLSWVCWDKSREVESRKSVPGLSEYKINIFIYAVMNYVYFRTVKEAVLTCFNTSSFLSSAV